GQLVVVVEQIVEISVVPARRLVRPRALEAAGDRVVALAGAEAVHPAEALVLDGATLGLGTDQVRIARTMALAEGVAAADEGDRLLVVHRHAGEGLPDVPG